MTEEMRDQLHAVDVITRVRDRLEAAGAMAELYRLRRFSVDELELLVRLELGVEEVARLPQDTSQRYETVAA